MRVILVAILSAGLSLATGTVLANSPVSPGMQNQIIHHGGGCRKSSPPGQCCHLEKKTGIVHYH